MCGTHFLTRTRRVDELLRITLNKVAVEMEVTKCAQQFITSFEEDGEVVDSVVTGNETGLIIRRRRQNNSDTQSHGNSKSLCRNNRPVRLWRNHHLRLKKCPACKLHAQRDHDKRRQILRDFTPKSYRKYLQLE
ncbi:hypothetical protein FQR65_LT13112 [Abscondita terminalis]|nr:hypothetical protein FQR65_LT13112 [Abscondita terminalis]